MIVCVTKITVASSRRSHVESPLFVEMTNQNFPLTIAVNHLLFSQFVSPFPCKFRTISTSGKKTSKPLFRNNNLPNIVRTNDYFVE